MATIYDVSKNSGVSPKTVSRIINGENYVKEDTRRKVLEVMRKMDFTPSVSARLLSRSKNKENIRKGNISLIATERHFDEGGYSFFPSVMSGIIQEAVKLKIKVFIDIIKDKYTDICDLPITLRETQLDGIIIMGYCDEKFVSEIIKGKTPVVFIENYLNRGDLYKVNVDNVQGSYEAVKYLIGRGHKKIGMIGCWLDDPITKERFKGARAAMEDYSLKYNENYIIEGGVYPGGYEAVEKMLANNGNDLPTAIFARDDLCAIGAREALEKKGFRVPEDISIIGFDDTELASQTRPPLTTVHVPTKEMGMMALRRLQDIITNTKEAVPSKILVTPKLVERESVRGI